MATASGMSRDTDDVLDQAASWQDTGCGVALATVVATWGSSPRPVGSQLAVNDAGAFVGIGATIIQSLRVGYESVIGAGAVVINNVNPMSTVVGVPARIVKRNGERVEEELPRTAEPEGGEGKR